MDKVESDGDDKPTEAMIKAFQHHAELVWYTNMGLYETARYIFTRWGKE